ANIGFRPSLRTPEYCLGPETGPTIEVHILDFDQPVYGASVQIEFVERLRPERSFASLEALRAQIAADVALSRLVLTGQTGCGPSHSAFSG
ncbi:MAG: riboflavin kinase, partial [candidate division WOR-3 bacterium]